MTQAEFFNRQAQLERLSGLIERLRHGGPEWLAIIGPRKVGKTSLLLESARRFAASDVGFIVFDVLDAMPVSIDVFRRLAARVLDVLLGEDAGVAPSRLMQHPAEYRAALLGSERYARLGRDLQSLIAELPERALDESLVRDCLELPERLAEKLDARLLIAIDEFQELAGIKGDPFPMMRSHWQRHRHVAYVISGSARSMLMELTTSERSPFFQHFAILEMGELSFKDAHALLIKSAPPKSPIPPEVAKRMVALVGGHPFYLQLFGEALTAIAPPYGERSLKEALQALLFSRTGRLALFFQNEYTRLVGSSTGLAATLEALAGGPLRVTDVAKHIRGSTGTANQYLSRLGDAVRAREDGRYEIEDLAFAAWIQWRAPGGTVVPMKMIGDEAETRVAEHLSRMGFDLIYQSRGSRGAFDLLATRGADQLGIQVKRSRLPLRFKKAAWNRMAADAKKWGWRWIVAAVADNGEVSLLDPALAGKRAEVSLSARARIENLLAWLA